MVQQSCAPPKQSVINRTWLRLSISSDWSIIMIGPGGLLLVVPTYMPIQLQFLLVGLPKQIQLNLDILFYYPEWHTEHRWRCSKLMWSAHYRNMWSIFIWRIQWGFSMLINMFFQFPMLKIYHPYGYPYWCHLKGQSHYFVTSGLLS
jgi:hypothetical protein